MKVTHTVNPPPSFIKEQMAEIIMCTHVWVFCVFCWHVHMSFLLQYHTVFITVTL